MNNPILATLVAALCFVHSSVNAQTCSAHSGDKITPVIELYTSEGCSSCPPADKWLTSLKDAVGSGLKATTNPPVVQAFHVSYWDYIGWVDRFAAPAHTTRQRQVSKWQNSGTIYTPQMVRDGRDWRSWNANIKATEPASVVIRLQEERPNMFSADISPAKAGASLGLWSAYWTVTEHGHASKVKAGENSGEFLQHDFVVRQYKELGDFSGAHKLNLQAPAKDPAHPRQINVVVYNAQTGKPLQAVSLGCG